DRRFYDKLTNVLDNFYNSFKSETKESINALFLPVWGDEKFKFIPEYEENPKYKEDKSQPEHIPTTLTQQQRVVFYAICRYFETGQHDEASLKQWMRVVWNIVENANITSVQSMIGAMRLIDELEKHSREIYSWLANDTNKIDSDAASEQVAEEREKIKQIINNPTENWEEKIIDAENTAFFKGAIRFMFTKEDGTYDWSLFDNRLKKSEEYFDEEGVKESYKIDITIALVKSLDNYDSQLWCNKHIFNTDKVHWKNILTNKDYISPVCVIFDATDLTSVETIDFSEIIYKDNIKKQLLEDGVIKFLVENNYWKNSRFRWTHNRPCLYPPYGQNYILFDWNKYNRNEKLKDLFDKGIVCDDKKQKIPGNNRLFQGNEIYLKKVGDIEYYWGEKLKKRDTKKNLNEEIVKDISGNFITIDTLEDYLKSL
ncbi:MAG: hypothetical protein LBG80_07765, partial [Bacteroidales bacterium]|nr:hypothetical protein [Bacteroidales bacterium]